MAIRCLEACHVIHKIPIWRWFPRRASWSDSDYASINCVKTIASSWTSQCIIMWLNTATVMRRNDWGQEAFQVCSLIFSMFLWGVPHFIIPLLADRGGTVFCHVIYIGLCIRSALHDRFTVWHTGRYNHIMPYMSFSVCQIKYVHHYMHFFIFPKLSKWNMRPVRYTHKCLDLQIQSVKMSTTFSISTK